MSRKINHIKNKAIEVFNDCLLDSGCVVAAPTHKDYYPKDAKSYMYSWPGRDLGFALAAMIVLKKDYYKPALTWIWDRAEDFQQSHHKTRDGLLYRSYHPNGVIREHQFQPDQGGTLLWSIAFKTQQTKKKPSGIEKKVIYKLMSGYERIWDKDHFEHATEDLWEERGYGHKHGNLTYSIAACATGINDVAKIYHNKKWLAIADSMKKSLLDKAWDEKKKFIPRLYGRPGKHDLTPDASLAGLVWPFNVGWDQDRLQSTIDRLENKLSTEYGMHRYPGDKYEGSAMDHTHHANEEAGTWPLLTFWMAIAQHELGHNKKADKYFNLTWKHVKPKGYIPEQIFCCSAVPWVGVSPLLWSHSQAVLAAWKLNKLK